MTSRRSLHYLTTVLPGLTLERLVVAAALLALLYLPIELALIGWMPDAAYWFFRLLPDGLIAALGLAVALTELPPRTRQVRLLWAIGVVCTVLIVANAVRGISPVDSINAIRVLVRYVILGVILWWALPGRASISDRALSAILIAAGIQVVIAAVQVAAQAANGLGPYFVAGTLGRYDRLGLLMMTFVVALVAASALPDRARIALIGAGLAVLYLTTSRQAMVGVAVAAAVVVVAPGLRRSQRAACVIVSATALGLILATPSRLPPPPGADVDARDPSGGAANPLPISGNKNGLQLTTDPSRNFRLFYNLELAPWAAATEPLLGFGPKQQVAASPDPRLVARVAAAGMDWSWARRFTNDSNFASLVVQFGVVAPALFLALVAWFVLIAGKAVLQLRSGFARFAFANAVATLVAAAFGPAFEIRTVSIILWVSLAIVASEGTVSAMPVALRTMPSWAASR